jgi:hypothetical protein
MQNNDTLHFTDAKDLGEEIVIIRLDADKNKTVMAALKISELPTLLLYDHATVTWKHSGFISEADLKKTTTANYAFKRYTTISR